MDELRLIFLILNYVRYDLTIGAVENIQKSIVKPEEYEILIVDNASPNDSYNILKEHLKKFDNIIVIRNSQNLGYASGNNFGFKYIERNFPTTKYVAVMNPDVRFFPNTDLERTIQKLENDSKLSIITPIHLLNKTFRQTSIAWKIPKQLDDFVLNFWLTSKFSRVAYKEFKIEDNKISYVDVVPGSFFIAKINTLKEVGYFDEKTFLYVEERILALKLSMKGYKCAIDFENMFIHDHSEKIFNLTAEIKNYNLLLKSRIYYNAQYNGKWKYTIIPLLIATYPLKLLEIVVKHMIKHLIKKYARW